MVALSTTKRNENEIGEFDKLFNQIAQKLHNDIIPPETMILIYYLDAFGLWFQISGKDP